MQEIKPEELHEITIETYTSYKKEYLEQNKDTPLVAIGLQNSF
ncbi:MAG: hypothetical protein WCJ45_07795 [bacterium]